MLRARRRISISGSLAAVQKIGDQLCPVSENRRESVKTNIYVVFRWLSVVSASAASARGGEEVYAVDNEW